eukprot:PhM_4_TR6665/c0_g1_i1/m.77604
MIFDAQALPNGGINVTADAATVQDALDAHGLGRYTSDEAFARRKRLRMTPTAPSSSSSDKTGETPAPTSAPAPTTRTVPWEHVAWLLHVSAIAGLRMKASEMITSVGQVIHAVAEAAAAVGDTDATRRLSARWCAFVYCMQKLRCTPYSGVAYGCEYALYTAGAAVGAHAEHGVVLQYLSDPVLAHGAMTWRSVVGAVRVLGSVGKDLVVLGMREVEGGLWKVEWERRLCHGKLEALQ